MADLTQYTCLDCGKPYLIDQRPDILVFRPTCPACRPTSDPDTPIEINIVKRTTIVPNWHTDSSDRLLSTNRALRDAGAPENG